MPSSSLQPPISSSQLRLLMVSVPEFRGWFRGPEKWKDRAGYGECIEPERWKGWGGPGGLHSRGELGQRMARLLVQTEAPLEQGAVHLLVEGPMSLLWDTGNLRTESAKWGEKDGHLGWTHMLGAGMPSRIGPNALRGFTLSGNPGKVSWLSWPLLSEQQI